MSESRRSGRNFIWVLARIALCSSPVVASLVGLPARGQAAGGPALVVSEITTGGASASDEFVELYNRGDAPASLAGLELVYVSASGATVTTRATWSDGSVPPGAHVLVANEAGIYRTIADELYAGGISATGGSAVLRTAGTGTILDAVGWGGAAPAWREGSAAAAPPPGESIERLPGGAAGSAQDTNDNARDFVVRSGPEPQNSGSDPTPPVEAPEPTPSPPSPSAGLTAMPSATPLSTPVPTRVVSPTPLPSASRPAATSTIGPSAEPDTTVSVATAREMPEGAVATIEATALTASTFTDGGGYVWDGTAGIAVLLSHGAFERGDVVRVKGTLDERYHQTTLRADDAVRLGSASDARAAAVATGSIGERHEARLVEIAGEVVGSPTELTAGRAYDVDDGSGAVRVLVSNSTGIDTTGWVRGARVRLAGLTGQRDSGGSGSAGYRVLPRDPADIRDVSAPATATPRPSSDPRSPTPSPTRSGVPGASPSARPEPVMSIADARNATPDARVRVRGTVTAERGRLLDEQSAVIQDDSGAILLRVPEDVAIGRRGDRIEVAGVRSTKGGMATIRVDAASAAGTGAEPRPSAVTTGSVAARGEELESTLVQVAGVVGSARRSTTGNVSFTLDDGSGPLRAFAYVSTGVDSGSIANGSWVELRGILGQDTSGDRPTEGYRVWPRDPEDVRTVAPSMQEQSTRADTADGHGGEEHTPAGGGGGEGAALPQDLGAFVEAGANGSAPGQASATLVVGEWPELGLAGVLWDGSRAVAISHTDETAAAVEELLADRTPPVVVSVSGSASPAQVGPFAAWSITADADGLERAAGRPAVPATEPPATGDPVVWAQVVGTLTEARGEDWVRRGDEIVRLSLQCDDAATSALRDELEGEPVVAVGLLGDAGGNPTLVAPCSGLRAAPRFAAGDAIDPAGARPNVSASIAEDSSTPERSKSLLLAGAGAVLAILLALVATLAWRTGTWRRLFEPQSRDDAVGDMPDASTPATRAIGPP